MLKEFAWDILRDLDQLPPFREHYHKYGEWNRQRLDIVEKHLKGLQDTLSNKSIQADAVCQCAFRKEVALTTSPKCLECGKPVRTP